MIKPDPTEAYAQMDGIPMAKDEDIFTGGQKLMTPKMSSPEQKSTPNS